MQKVQDLQDIITAQNAQQPVQRGNHQASIRKHLGNAGLGSKPIFQPSGPAPLPNMVSGGVPSVDDVEHGQC